MGWLKSRIFPPQPPSHYHTGLEQGTPLFYWCLHKAIGKAVSDASNRKFSPQQLWSILKDSWELPYVGTILFHFLLNPAFDS